MKSMRSQILLLTLIRIVINTMIRMVYPFLPVFGRSIGLSLQSLSIALTARSLIGSAGPLLASIADEWGRKRGMALGLGLYILGLVSIVYRPNFQTFFIALLLTALGKAVFDPSMQAYLADRVPYAQRGKVLGFTEFGWSVSFIVGVPFMGYLIAQRGWSTPFSVLMGLGVLLFFGLLWYLPRDHIQQRLQTSVRARFRLLLGYQPLQAGFAVGLLASAANEMVNLVFGLWMEDSFGLRIMALSGVALVIGIAELSGESLVSGLSDRLGKKRAVAIGLIANCVAALLLPVFGKGLLTSMVGLFFFYLSFEFSIVSSIPMMTQVMPAARATVMGIYFVGISLGRALGALVGPHLYLSRGILLTSFAVVAINILALVILRRVRVSTPVRLERI